MHPFFQFGFVSFPVVPNAMRNFGADFYRYAILLMNAAQYVSDLLPYGFRLNSVSAIPLHLQFPASARLVQCPL